MMQHRIVDFEIKSAAPTGKEFEGHANAFFNLDSAQEIVDNEGFYNLPQFLEEGFVGGLNHNWDDPIGKPTIAKTDAIGLYVGADIDVDTPEAHKCRQLILKKIIKKLSIGYKVLGSQLLETAEDVAAYWQGKGYQPSAQDIARAQYGARLLTKIHLYEFSPVTVPANDLADITRVKKYSIEDIDTERDLERFLRDAGFSRKVAVAIARPGFKAIASLHLRDAESEEDPSPPPPEPEEKAEEVKTPTETPAEDAGVFVESLPAALSPALQSEAAKLFADFQRISLRGYSALSR